MSGRPVAKSSAVGGSSPPIYGIASISISPDQPICRSVLRAGPSLALGQSTPPLNSNTVGARRSAELQDDGSLEIELSFDDGDDAILTAHREMTSSVAC